MKDLDSIQKALISFFKKNTNQEGITLREIAHSLGINHPQTVLNKLNQLVLKGYFIKDEHGYRLIRETFGDRMNDVIQLPIYGFAQCGNKGKKILDEYSQEKIPVTIAMLGVKDINTCFFVRAKGNSMEPKIQDGDLVLIKQQPSYDPSDYVFVLHNNLPKLKRILKKDGKMYLESVNRFFDNVEVEKYDETKVVGVVKKVIKNM
ncbi:MAG: S24 family peptidase [Candidatus Absconditabacterales bacterium]|jgi:SOS-response transcriptional repressor LexA